MKTARGVYLNLKESVYVFTIGEIKFYFSSDWNRTRFMNRYLEEKEKFNTSLNRIYKERFDLSGDVLAWIRLYTKIEKRGFYLVVNGCEITCLEDLAFDVTLIYKMK